MNYQQRLLKNSDYYAEEDRYEKKEKELISTLISISKFSINKKSDIEAFFREVVNQISSLIPCQKVSLSLKGKDEEYESSITADNIKTIYVPINISANYSEMCIGYIKLQKGKDQSIEPEEIRFLEIISYITALKFKSSIMQLFIYEGIIQTLQVLVNTVEAKDIYTKFHSQRVAHYSVGIAKVIGLPKEDKDIIKIAGILHDIGKIAIPENILLKEGKLTDEEFDIIKTHPIFGNEILKPLRFFNQEREIVLYHHERWDGSGYPKGLAGEDIPLGARILAVVDSFDAMTSDRVYRKGRSFEEALKEIKELAGIKYDPYIVNAFDFFMKREYLK